MPSKMMRMALAVVGLVGFSAPAFAQSDFKVTLLGTGSPTLDINRFSMSTLVEAGSHKLLFDAGRGASLRLSQLGIPLGKVDGLFLTHYHSDHVVGIPDLWLSGWSPSPYGQRKGTFKVTGPTGVNELMDGLQKAYAADIRIRIADEHRPLEAVKVEAKEFAAEGVVFDEDGVKVTAFEVDHGDLIKPSFGYRVDFGGRSVVLSGDTRFSENLIKHSTGVNLLIHEVAVARPEIMNDPFIKAIMAHHVTPKEAGTVFSRTKPKLAVYSHLVFQNRPQFPAVGVKDIVEQTKETYTGPLEVGEDLMAFEILQNEVRVIQPKK
jgi:ribonuclease Z